MKPYITIPLTSKCNLRCAYCPPLGETYLTSRSSFQMTDLSMVLKGAKDLGIEKVRFTGGESFLFPELRYAIEKAVDLGLEVHVNTNGTLILRHLNWLQKMSAITIKPSLDTFSLNNFRILSGSDQLENIIQSIRTLAKEGVALRVNTVVTKVNYQEVKTIMDFCRGLRISMKILDMFVVPETEKIWERYYVPLKALGITGEKGVSYDYTLQFGIPTDELIVDGLKVRLKDSANGTHYHLSACATCPHFPCQEGFYCLIVTPTLTVVPCRLGKHLFRRCSSFGELKKAISQTMDLYLETQHMNLFWESHGQFYNRKSKMVSQTLMK